MNNLRANVFIEGSKIYFAQKKMGKWLDWLKVKKYLEENYSILLHKKGKKLYVYSSRKTLSWELKLSADKYFLLENLSELTKGKDFAGI